MRLRTRPWLVSLDLNKRIALLVGILALTTIVMTTLMIRSSTLHIVESAIGDQMLVQARIAAHLVAVAEERRERGMTPAEIKHHLTEITRFAKEQRTYDYEFWVTDDSGKVYIGTVPTAFTFTADQPQAGAFLRLLNNNPDHVDVVVQENRRREIDSSVYKYVGVSGVDRSRIVQVGYNADSLLAELAVMSTLQAAGVAGLLLGGGFVAYFILRRLLTVPLNQLIRAARAVEAERYEPGSLSDVCARGDELGHLARVFEGTVGKLAARYESLVNLMRSVVLKVRGDGVIVFANAYASELLQFSNAELVGQPLSRILPPEWREPVQRRLESLRPDQVQPNETNENVSKSGERHWITWMNCVIKAGTGAEKELLCVGNDVTSEVNQRLAIQEREEQFGALLEATPDALIISDDDGLIRLVNAQTERLLGYGREELIGQAIEMLVPERVRAGHPALRRRYLSSPDFRPMGSGLELTAVRKDGSEFAVEISLSPLKSPDRRSTLVCSSLRDITERKRLEQEVRVSEERNRLILQSTAEGIFGVDTDGRITFVNAATCSMLGFTADELIGRPSHELIHHHRADGRPYPVEECPMYAAYKLGTASRVEDEFLWRKDGAGLPVEYGATPMLKDGSIVGAVISFTDVTERRKAEAELKRIHFLADTALDLTRAGYWHVPLDGSGWYNSSERAARIFGDPPTPDHRYTLQHWTDHVRLGDEAAARATGENFQAAVAGNVPVYDATYAYRRPVDGRVVWIHAMGHVVKDGSGRPTDMFGVTQDITDFKNLETDLRQAMQKAEEATKAKSAFLANMSHEIRTPMNGIMGMTELALDTDLTAEQRDYLNTVKSSAEALLSLINDILDFSKIEAGRIELDPIEFLLRDAISDTLNPLALRASSKGLELAYDVHGNVPDALIGDVYRLRQILVNLVGNAIKFTDRGEVVVSVGLAERTADELLLEVRVRDTGIGIKPEAAARLFTPFEQAEASTTRKYGGTGLGLAISRQLVGLMGGEIRLESEPGAGSTFIFTARFKPGIPRASPADADASRLFHDKTALVVDDNETNRRILTTMLGHWGLRALAADSAAAGLATLDRARNGGQPVTFVITDLHMPETDGFQLTEMLRSRTAYANLPVFLLTSSASPGDNARCAELRIAARLLKPVKQSLLLDNILRVLGGADRTAASAATQPSDPSAPAEAQRRTLQVLLAEDNPVNQKFAVRVLSGAGHEVTIANNGREAIELSASRPFHLILMDVQMPEVDGLDATRAIRAREAGSNGRIPIIAMTANAMKGDREACIEAGMDGYVPKPVKKEALFAEIDRILKERTHGTVI